MSDSPDILDKADALLERYRGGVKPAIDAAGVDTDFPILTEIVAAPGIDFHAPRADEIAAPQARSDARTEDYSEDRLLQEVMRSLAPRIEEMLGDPLTQRLEEHVRGTVQTLSQQVRMDIEAMMRIAISRAVEQVLSEKKGR